MKRRDSKKLVVKGVAPFTTNFFDSLLTCNLGYSGIELFYRSYFKQNPVGVGKPEGIGERVRSRSEAEFSFR
jgi:hypothetical protein